MKPKLNTVTALITVALYLVGSIVAGVLAAIFFGGVGEAAPDARNIDGLIDNTTIAYLILTASFQYSVRNSISGLKVNGFSGAVIATAAIAIITTKGNYACRST